MNPLLFQKGVNIMNLMELKKQLSEGTLNPLYIFTGEEVSIMDIYIDKISRYSGNDRNDKGPVP